MPYSPYEIKNFIGINNVDEPENLINWRYKSAGLTTGKNIDVSSGGKISRRQGFTRVLEGSFHSLFDGYAVADGMLVRLSGDPLVAEPLMSVGHRRVTFADTGPFIYASNEVSVWRINGSNVVEVAAQGSYSLSDALSTDGLYDGIPPAKILSFGFGRLWAVTDVGIFYSQPYEFENFNLESDYIDFPSCTGITFVDNGMYLGSKKDVLYLNGGNPNSVMQTSTVSTAGCFFGSMIEVNSEDFSLDERVAASGKGAIWESSSGKVLGLSGGTVLYLTKDKFVNTVSDSQAASFVKNTKGQKQHISSFYGEGSGMSASDTASAEVIRNGQPI